MDALKIDYASSSSDLSSARSEAPDTGVSTSPFSGVALQVVGVLVYLVGTDLDSPVLVLGLLSTVVGTYRALIGVIGWGVSMALLSESVTHLIETFSPRAPRVAYSHSRSPPRRGPASVGR